MSSSSTSSTVTEPVTGGGDVEELRKLVHVVDLHLVNEIRARIRLSRRVQEAKIAAGQSRVDLSQESRVIKYYSDNLGPEGAVIAMHLLALAKSNITV